MASSTTSGDRPAAGPIQGAAARARQSDVVIGLTGAGLGMLTTVMGPYLSFRPNRIVDGLSQTALEAFGPLGWLALALWALSALVALTRPRAWTGVARAALGSGAVLTLLAAAGAEAASFAAVQGAAARTSFGASFYLALLAAFLVSYSASAETPGRRGRTVIALFPIIGLVALTATGALAELGIVREWVLTRPTFVRELRRHLFYALGATGGAIALGIPMGVLSARSRHAETAIMGSLNLGQVFPALAFVGIMMPILGALGDRFSAVKALGISGIGWAPVFVVLLVYALFPVTRNTLVAIRQIDPAVLDTARGMGMGRWRSLFEVEMPLAFPVVLAGVRIALVQSTAGAILAAFVGGGGLGTIMFFGLEQTSMDLVLVGVLPIVALALVFDAGLRVVERMAGGSEESYA
ncbi:MAG: ABC transporter permease [Coriobacteriia bacterium]|nr:ABC transporter permease [Coriobacteriia bacterium]